MAAKMTGSRDKVAANEALYRDLIAIAIIAYQPNVLIVQIGRLNKTSDYVEIPKV
jgi:hypothetical protein